MLDSQIEAAPETARAREVVDAVPVNWAERMTWWQAALGLILLLLAFNWPLWTGRAFETWDAFDFFAPYYSLVADFARAGRLLSWNPWTNGGSPDFAEPQVGAFSPITVLCGAITGGSPSAFRVYWMLLWLLGGMGMLCLARHLRAPVWGGFTAALAFMCSGYFTGHAQHTSVIYSFAFLPWMVWRLDAATVSGRLFAGVQAGALWGLSALAGNPAVTILMGLFAPLWVLARIIGSGSFDFAALRRGVTILALFSVIGLAVLSPTYFSFIHESAGFSDRSQPLTREFVLESNNLAPGAVASLASPYVANLKLYNHSRLWPQTDISGACVYAGGIATLLAMLALVSRPADRWRWALLALGLLALGCALATVLPLRGWLYDLVPPTRYFRHPSMFRGGLIFILSVLAILASRDLASGCHPGLRKRFAILAAVLAALAIATVSVAFVTLRQRGPDAPLAIAHLLLVWGGAAVVAWAASRPSSKLAGRLPAALVALAVIDGALTFSLSQTSFYNLSTPPDLAQFHVAKNSPGAEGLDRKLVLHANTNLYARLPVLGGYAPLKNGLHEKIMKEPTLARMALGTQRFWFAPVVPEVPCTPAAFDAVARLAAATRAPIFVRHSREAMLDHAAAGSVDEAALAAPTPPRQIVPRAIDYQPDAMSFTIECPAAGWLLVTDRWSRSWRALCDGRETPVLGGNFIFRAIAVPAGLSRVDLIFEPLAVPELVILSWGLLALIGTASVVTMSRPASR